MADPVVPLDIEAYLEEKVLEQDPSFELREGSTFRDFFIKPMTLILQPIRDEIAVVRTLQSLLNFASMSDEDLDALLANMFLPRRTGSFSSGTARVYFAAPQNSVVSAGAAILSASGLRFLVDETTTISASVMSVNVDGASFFFDFAVTAESPGEAYNIAPGSIVASEVQISGSTRITNTVQFTGGLATETNTEYFNRAQTAVTVRNVVNDRSVITTLLDRFPFVKSITPIGFNDPEMERAALTVLLPGPPQHTVRIPDRGGRADIYIEGDAFEERSVTVQDAPAVVSTNNQRGLVTTLDFGFRRIAVQGGFFDGVNYPGDAVVILDPNLRYTLSLALSASGQEYELDLATTVVTNPYPAVPADQVPIANLQTDGAGVTELVDIRVNVFTFDRPVISMDSAELLDPVSLQPTGTVLRTGDTALVTPSIAVDPGSDPHAVLSPGSGDWHIVFRRADGVYYQRHDSLANIVTPAVQISTDVNASNIRIAYTLQENVHVFFLNFAGDLRYLQIDNTGAVLVAESTVSGAGVTTEFTVQHDTFGFATVLSINDALGQADLYFLRINAQGVVITAQTLVHSEVGGNSSAPSLAFSYTPVPSFGEHRGIAGETDGTDEFEDLTATFVTDGVAPGDRFRLLSGDSLPTAEQATYVVSTVDSETRVTFTGAPVITASPGVVYEVYRDGTLAAAWLNDISGNKNVRALELSNAGVPVGPADGEPVVLSDPTTELEATLPVVVFQPIQGPLSEPGFTVLWVHNGSAIMRAGLSGLAAAVTSATGDTQATGISRSFFDAGAPFVATDVGKYVAITAGSGLTAADFRLYQILEFVTTGHVLLNEPVTDSTAADIEYAIVTVPFARQDLAPDLFLNQITALQAVVDQSSQVHVGVIETAQNTAKVYLGKYSRLLQPLLHPVFVRVSSSVNNRSSLSIDVDPIRQPYLVWDDFSAQAATVQLAKFQAQEFAYLVNDPGYSYSVREDASIFLDPSLVGQAIRFNYTHSTRVDPVEEFLVNTVNRILIGNYLARHTMPAFVDVDLTYSGANAPDEASAVELLEEFIDNIGSQITPPSIQAVVTRSTIGDTLEKSDLVDVLYDAGADSVRIDGEIRVDEAQTDGSTRTRRDIDRLVITRTARFIARTVTVTRE